MKVLALAALLLTVACVAAQCVCWIRVLARTFRANAGLGLVGLLCMPFAFLWGWRKAREYGMGKLMLWWTASLAGTVAFWVLSGVLGMAAVAPSAGGP